MSRQCAGRRSPIRAGAQTRRSAQPSERAGAVSPADQMAIVKPPLPGLDHVADAAPRPHEVVDVAPPGHQPPRRIFQRSPASSPQYAADGVPVARAHLTATRTKERFRLTGNRPWPHCGPTEHLDRADPPAARSEKSRKCSEFLESGEWAIQDSNLGPLPYQRSPWAKQAVATGHESPQKSCKSGPTSIVGRNRTNPRELILVDAEWTCCAEAGRVRSGGMPHAG